MEQALEELLSRELPNEDELPRELHRAMRYGVQGGGRRFRPLLLLATAYLGGRDDEALPAACSVELVHAYSLIHDDLPCMDDDDLRRGRPSCHRRFGEAVAILAGNALLTLAFSCLLQYPPDRAVGLIQELAVAAGHRGLLGGQVADLCGEPGARAYLYVARTKTGALFRACLRMGGEIAGEGQEGLQALDRCADHLGLAFQLQDDVADWETDREKQRGMNAVAIWGSEECLRRARAEMSQAQEALQVFGSRADLLRHLLSLIKH